MTHPPSEQPRANSKWLALMGVGMGIFMSTLDASIVNISLPTLAEEFNTQFATVQWVVLSYTLVLAAFLLSVARLGDMFNKKPIYQSGMALFTFGSLLCGLAPTVGWLIAFRTLQGLGAVMMQALGMGMITEFFPPNERGRALGIAGGIVSFGIALGPAVGGLLIGTVGWHWIFLVNVPIGIIASLIVRRYVPTPARAAAGQRFDSLGAFLLFVILTSYALGMTLGQNYGFSATLPLSMLLLAAFGLVVLMAAERRVPQPMIDPDLFRNLLFSINLMMGFLVFLVLAGTFVLPFYLELVKGFDTRTVGLLIMVNPAAGALFAPLAGALSDRYGSRGISFLGLLVLTAAFFWLSTLNETTSTAGIALRMAPLGIGFSLFQSPNNSAIMGAAPRHRLGIASGLLALTRNLGTASGLPLMGAIYTLQVQMAGNLATGFAMDAAPTAALVGGLQSAVRIVAAFMMLATVLAAAAIVLDQRRKRSEAALKAETHPSA